MHSIKRRQRGGRLPNYATDHDGAAIVRVPLANTNATAKMLAEDFARLTERGISLQWTFNPSSRGGCAYVKVGHADATGGLVTVARLVMAPPKRRMVRYRDGDRTNLRRDNLYLALGRAGEREAAIMEVPDETQGVASKGTSSAPQDALAEGAPASP